MCIRQLMSGETTTSAPLRDDVLDLGAAHRQRRAGHLHAERAAEAAALLDVGQLAVLQPADVLQQRQRRLDHAQLAPRRGSRCACVTLCGKRAPGVGHAEHVDQELGQLEHAAADLDDLADRDRRGRRTRGTWPCTSPTGRRSSGTARTPRRSGGSRLAGLFPVARVERRLAAAGLLLGKDHRHAVAAAAARPWPRPICGIELVDVAGDEQRHRLARLVLGVLPLRRRSCV